MSATNCGAETRQIRYQYDVVVAAGCSLIIQSTSQMSFFGIDPLPNARLHSTREYHFNTEECVYKSTLEKNEAMHLRQ